jgi:hypothetical protein
MKLLSEYIEKPLRLVRRSIFVFTYDLVTGEEILGTFDFRLFFNKGGNVKGLEKRNVEFYKSNFWSREVLVREEGCDLPFANYKRDVLVRTGNVFLPNGNKLTIHFGFFDIATEIRDDKGKVLVLLKRAGLFTRAVNVRIKEKSDLIDNNPWIIFLLLYLIIKRRQRRR